MEFKSDYKVILYRVPENYILGPLLFLINNMPKHLIIKMVPNKNYCTITYTKENDICKQQLKFSRK